MGGAPNTAGEALYKSLPDQKPSPSLIRSLELGALSKGLIFTSFEWSFKQHTCSTISQFAVEAFMILWWKVLFWVNESN